MPANAIRPTEVDVQTQPSQEQDLVGPLAALIAHDFNNLLTAIAGHGHLLLPRVSEDDPNRRHVVDICHAAEQASKLAQQLLSLSRVGQPEAAPVNLAGLVTNLEGMLRSILSPGTDQLFRVQADIWPIRADSARIEQLILNLAFNARDAMPRGGTFILEAANTLVEGDRSIESPQVQDGLYVVLTVSDTGLGMTPRIRDRVFEPFFTTKARGHGTGLGLASVRDIVQECGGTVVLYSEPGLGTTFKIYFPKLIAEHCPVPTAVADDRELPPGGGETILLVEDDEMVRELAAEVLGDAGYVVITAGTAQEAQQRAAEEGPGIRLLLADVHLPRSSGSDLALQLLETNPELSVLLMSGHTEAAVRSAPTPPKAGMLHKPFTPRTLLQKVRDSLECR